MMYVKALAPLALHTASVHEGLLVQVGPGRSLMQGEAPDKALARLQAALAAFTGPPFTLQRLAELLLEPRKQYSQMHKLVRLLLPWCSLFRPGSLAHQHCCCRCMRWRRCWT